MFKLAFRSIRAPVARASFVKPIRFYVAPPISKDEVTSRAIQALNS